MNADRPTANRSSALGLALADRETPTVKRLPHEKLDAFTVAIELVERVSALRVPRGHASIVEQLRRSTSSVALNIAEGCGKHGRDRQRFFAIARGSALESAAALRVLLAMRAVSAAQHDAARHLCERLYAMLTRLVARS